MEHGLPPSAPNSPLGGQALIDLLAQLDLLGTAPLHGGSARPSLVDGLGRWLGWADAIPLSAALKPQAPVPASGAAGQAQASQAAQALQRTRGALLRAIDSTGQAAVAGRADTRYLRQSMTVASTQTAMPSTDFSPYRQRYTRLQQAMEAGIAPVRSQLRAALAGLSPALAQLAALDAVMDERLGGREQSLLAMMPSLLQRHFERLQLALPGAWLAPFQADMKRLLQAELDLRLQPAWGLLGALQGAPTGPISEPRT